MWNNGLFSFLSYFLTPLNHSQIQIYWIWQSEINQMLWSEKEEFNSFFVKHELIQLNLE